MLKRFLLAVILACGLSAPAWAGFDEGVVAYERGDYKTAYNELLPLAEQGDAAAQFYLGFMYETGQGVAQDDAEAVKWYRRAAEQGDADAQNNLGLMYEYGEGVAQDYVQAHMWYSLAASRLPSGDERDETVKNRDIVEKRMTPAQVAEAQKLAREWKPKAQAEN